MEIGTVLSAVADSPFLLFLVVAVFLAVWAIEKLTGSNGPVTRLWTWWEERELRKLKREALLRAERRRIEQQESSHEVASLTAQVEELRGRLDQLIGWQRTRVAYDQTMLRWAYDLYYRAAAAGLVADLPPEPPEVPEELRDGPRDSAPDSVTPR